MRTGDLRQRLRDAPVPNEHEAGERGWRMARAAFAERGPVRRGQSLPARLVVALAAVGLLLAIVLTPAGAKVVDLVSDVVRPGPKQATPLTELPAPGRLLVESPQGPWVVDRDGSQRLLGDYEDAGWSPNGLFVAVTAAHQLSAVEPDGTPHWSLNRRHPVDPRWMPDTGIRVAYRTGSSMRVVGGDGIGDHELDPRVAPTAPAWSPVPSLEQKINAEGVYGLALAKPDGRVEMVEPDSGNVLWSSEPGPVPRTLEWSADGSRLVALSAAEIRVFSADGRLLDTMALPGGMRATDGAFAPSGKSFAVTATSRSSHGAKSRALLIDLGASQPESRSLLTDPGTFSNVSWSPDGSWLLVAWRDADAWLFLRPRHPGSVETTGGMSAQFSPGSGAAAAFPRPAGWCCTASGAG